MVETITQKNNRLYLQKLTQSLYILLEFVSSKNRLVVRASIGPMVRIQSLIVRQIALWTKMSFVWMILIESAGTMLKLYTNELFPELILAPSIATITRWWTSTWWAKWFRRCRCRSWGGYRWTVLVWRGWESCWGERFKLRIRYITMHSSFLFHHIMDILKSAQFLFQNWQKVKVKSMGERS